jgi:hypothetical protein
MHKTARHAIHLFKTLSVLVEIIETIQQQVVDLPTIYRQGRSGRAEVLR